MKGRVKFFNPTKGFGFIVADDGKEYFVHLTGLAKDTRLHDNSAVTFDVEEGDRGPKAVNVSLAQEDGESSQDDSSDDEESNRED